MLQVQAQVASRRATGIKPLFSRATCNPVVTPAEGPSLRNISLSMINVAWPMIPVSWVPSPSVYKAWKVMLDQQQIQIQLYVCLYPKHWKETFSFICAVYRILLVLCLCLKEKKILLSSLLLLDSWDIKENHSILQPILCALCRIEPNLFSNATIGSYIRKNKLLFGYHSSSLFFAVSALPVW